jgi:hypothetical protein
LSVARPSCSRLSKHPLSVANIFDNAEHLDWHDSFGLCFFSFSLDAETFSGPL